MSGLSIMALGFVAGVLFAWLCVALWAALAAGAKNE
jgi:hypothetical protein